MENLFQDIKDTKAREQALAETARSVSKGKIKKGFSDAELSMFKDQLMSQSMQLNDKLDELKALSAPLKSDIKELKSVIRDLCVKLRDKAEEMDGTIFHFEDENNGVMVMYNSLGEFQGTRKLLPGDRQATITPISKTA